METTSRNGRGNGAAVLNGSAASVSAAERAAERATPERDRAIELAVSNIEKQFGRGAIMRLGEGSIKMAVDAIPTGAIALDLALGVGGFPRGRVIEIYGPESSGKTTLALHVIAEAQRQGGVAAIIDAEHALDPVMAQNMCGV